jgi:phage terminase large subunit-like protein
VFPRGERRYDAFGLFWTPADTLIERADKDRAPYPLWVEQGHLIATPGKVVNYAWVAQRIAELMERFALATLAFDEYRIERLEAELLELGVAAPFLKHPQGFRRASASPLWMPESIDELEHAVIEGRIRIARNPVMSWCAASAVLEADAQGNRKFAKQKATGRIDGVVALAMAMGAATMSQGGGGLQSPWEDEGFRLQTGMRRSDVAVRERPPAP